MFVRDTLGFKLSTPYSTSVSHIAENIKQNTAKSLPPYPGLTMKEQDSYVTKCTSSRNSYLYFTSHHEEDAMGFA